MGKEDQRRKLKRVSEEGGTGFERKERRQKGLKEDASMECQREERKREAEEETVDRAIEEMLAECRQKAFEGDGTPDHYDLGGDLGDKRRQPVSPGQGWETTAASQADARSKQSAGMDRRQRRALAEEKLGESTGEVLRSSQFACDLPPRLDLKPSRGEDFLTEQPTTRLDLNLSREEEASPEHCGHKSWQMTLKSACARKDSLWSDLGPALSKSLEVLSKTTRCGQSTEGLFPLPLPGRMGWCEVEDPLLEGLVRGLNSLYGVEASGGKKVTKAQRRILERLRGLLRSSSLPRAVLPTLTFGEFFTTKGIDYSGEEVRVARSFQWKMVEAAFPEGVGSLDLLSFCDGGTRSYVSEFERFLLPPQDQSLGKTPATMVSQEHWAEVCLGLVNRGVCGLMKKEELYHVSGRAVLNGLFAVEKGEKAVDEKGKEFEVCRLIMNLVPTNGLCRNLVGDTSTLPTVTGMSGTVLRDGELLLTSSEDIRCFFYLFRTPPEWHRFMGFGREVPPEGLPAGFKGHGWHLVSRVLPMGFINSVAIAQHVHRRVIQQALGGERKLAGKQQEIRRDRHQSSAAHQYRVYLDNYDELNKVDKQLAKTLNGTPSAWTLAVRETYQQLGLPRHPKKAVTQEVRAEVQGAWVDGELGRATPKLEKVGRYVQLALELCVAGRASQREFQVVGGGFVYIAMFRRPLLSGLNAVWKQVTDLGKYGPVVRKALPQEVMLELLRFVVLCPLAYMDFRLATSELVTASDASTTGGGLCVSRELSPFGVSACQAECRGDVVEPDEVDQVLVVSLFDGIGALRVALDALRVPVGGYVSVEISPEANRVVESFFPDVVCVGDVASVTSEDVLQWRLRFANVGLVLLGAGPPCQGVSGLNSDRKGALRDERSCLFQHVPRVESLLREHFKWCPVHRLVENVASMDADDCQTMSLAYGAMPWSIDAGGLSLARRPRLYWCSWEPFRLEGATVVEGREGALPVRGKVILDVKVDERDFLEAGWRRVQPEASFPTFTTSRPSALPGRRPAGLALCPPDAVARWKADLHRFPPYQYRKENCVTNQRGEVRVPSVGEREVILGFPLGYTRRCLVKSMEGSTAHNDCRLTLLGNSWSIPVVVYLLYCLFRTLGLLPQLDLATLVERLTPGREQQLSSLLMRPPMRQTTKAGSEQVGLVGRLMGQVSVKGEDILLQLGSDLPARYHRLRASVPSKLWRWKDVAGWRWTGDAEHINALELRAVKTAIIWRLKELEESECRFLHLVDSLVVLHALSRGDHRAVG